jgi:DNA modification methylase
MKRIDFNNMSLYNENCIDVMTQLKLNNVGVDLTVTSPPYDNLRTYNGSSSWNFEAFKEVAKDLWDITNDGGVVVWVVGDAVINGSETGSSFRQALYFMELGFKLWDTMIYEKNSSSFPAKRNGKRYTQIFEYMFVLVKGKMHDCHLLADKPNKWAGYTNWGNNTQYNKDGVLVQTNNIKPVPQFSLRNNIWKYSVGFNTKKFGKHPAVFPLQLAIDHILSWSLEEYTIFDPFLGSGTTMDACVKTNRNNFIGCEIDEEYFEIIRKKVDFYKNGGNL